jgi:hypothetical protein
MSAYNTLRITVPCPRCGQVGSVEAEIRFGDTSRMLSFSIGDRYPWVPRKSVKHGGRPEGGSMAGDGYMECERCRKDSFLRVLIRDDVIVAVEPNTEKAGYIE